MELKNSAPSLERLNKSFAGTMIKSFQLHIQIISKRVIDPDEIFRIGGRHKNIPIEGKARHAFL